MDVYDNFAANLRALCEKRGTITSVCKELGVNRQQFTKYLNGETFPRRDMLRKICRYFKIRDVELFLDPKSRMIVHEEGAIDLTTTADFDEILQQLQTPQEMPLEDGLYVVYFRMASRQDWIVRSAMSLKTSNGITEFRRLTGWGEKRSSAWSLFMGNHRGIVLNRRGHFYFCGMDKYGAQTPNLTVLHWNFTMSDVLTGRALVMATKGVEVCDVVVEKHPASFTLRRALSNSHAVGFNEKSLPRHVRQLFNNM